MSESGILQVMWVSPEGERKQLVFWCPHYSKLALARVMYAVVVYTYALKQVCLGVQYSPKIMHVQEVRQEVLAPQEHASS